MSATDGTYETSSITDADCAECGGDRDPHASVKGSYCSEECYYRHKGSKALNIVENDHRICASCLRFIKQVERAPEEWRRKRGSPTQVAIEHGAEYHTVEGEIALDATDVDARPTNVDSVCGYQYGTGDSEHVVKEYETEDGQRVHSTGLGCKCGNTDASAALDYPRDAEPKALLVNYIRTFRRLYDEGKAPERIDKDVFFTTFKESRDWEYALGKALYSG